MSTGWVPAGTWAAPGKPAGSGAPAWAWPVAAPLRGPLHGVAEAGVEGPEVLGGVDDRVTGEVVRDARRLCQAVEEISRVVVVDGDEPGDVDVRRVLRHVRPVGLHLGRVRRPRVGEDGADRVHPLTGGLAAVHLELQVGPAAPALQPRRVRPARMDAFRLA